MPNAFESWTVCPHKPIEKLEENLWLVHGGLPKSKTHRIMTVVRRRDGGLIIHNAVALDDAEMVELERFGTPAFLVVPSGYHRMDAKIFKDRYPKAVVVCPRGARKRVSQVVPPEVTYDALPEDPDVTLQHLHGVKEAEGVVQVGSAGGVSLIFNDALCNMPLAKGLQGFIMGPTGRPSVPRIMRWLAVKDKAALAGQLRELAGTRGLKRLIFGHGQAVAQDAAEILRRAADGLSS